MTAPAFIAPQLIDHLREVARKKGVFVWIDSDARHSGQAFIWLKRNDCVLAEFWDDRDALEWLGGAQ